MKFRSAEDVMRVARDRGFQVLVDPGPPPMPFLRGPRTEATEALVGALRAWRVEVIEALKREGKTGALAKDEP